MERVITTHNAAVSASFQATKSLIAPIMKRKNGLLRTCGQKEEAVFDATAGRFNRNLLSKPPRWVIRVEGDLTLPDDLSVEAERCVGSFNFNKGADIVAVRLFILHREQKGDKWQAFEGYEHRLLLLANPLFPEGSSSATVYCNSYQSITDSTPEENLEASEEDTPSRPGERPPLDSTLSVQRRGAPARQVEIAAALLLSPPKGAVNALPANQQMALESAVVALFDHWSLSMWAGEQDKAPVIAFAKALDDLEPTPLATTLAEADSQLAAGNKSENVTLASDVCRRTQRAIVDGFQHFIIVSRDAEQSHALGDFIIESLPISMARLSLLRSAASLAHGDTLQIMQQHEGWVLHVRQHQDALSVLDMARIHHPMVWLTLPLTFDVDTALSQSLRFTGIEPPSNPRELRQHALAQTIKILMIQEGITVSPRLVNQFFQTCLYHAPSASWDVPLDDNTRQIWMDALCLLLPPMISVLSTENKATLLAKLCEKMEISAKEERHLKNYF